MADEGYYEKFLRNANQSNKQEELSITIKFPSDRGKLRKWFFWWYFIQCCSFGVIITLLPSILSLNIIAVILAVPSVFILGLSWYFQRHYPEIYKSIFARLWSKEKKDDV